MFWRKNHVSCAEKRVWPSREDSDFFVFFFRTHPCSINFKNNFRAFAAANPVPLHFLERIAPVNRVEVGQEFLGVGGDAEHPLAHWLADDRKAADFAFAVNDFFVRQHRAEFGTPVHWRFADVGEALGVNEGAAFFCERGIPLIADGGNKYSGDVTKAIAAGANVIMIGSLFAGVDESPGETILYQGRSFKADRGMGSLSAMAQGSGERYFQGKDDLNDAASTERPSLTARESATANRLAKYVPEGIEGRVPHRGPLESMVFQLVGGLRSGMGYLGCGTIAELQTNARFIRISNAGLRESHVHDVIITREAPNYHVE